jgi:hypothetical protein
MQAVYQADKPGQSIDSRLLIGGIGAAAPSNFSNEASGQDGGFLVPPQFSQEIFKLSLGEDSLLPLTDNVEISGNSMAFPKDETTPWGTNGIRAYWQGEAATALPTKPVLGLATLRLKKLMALVPDHRRTARRRQRADQLPAGEGRAVDPLESQRVDSLRRRQRHPGRLHERRRDRHGRQGIRSGDADAGGAEPRQDDRPPAARVPSPTRCGS